MIYIYIYIYIYMFGSGSITILNGLNYYPYYVINKEKKSEKKYNAVVDVVILLILP